MKKPLYGIIIMDGFGIRTERENNAVLAQGTPNILALKEKYPHTLIYASGMDVGLPDGQMGNSEVGHTNIGAGRVVYQELTRITKSINDGDFFEKPELINAIDSAVAAGKALHVMGLLSDGGVHSHNTHLYATLELAKRRGLKKIYVHCFMDGRDVSPSSGINFMRELEQKLDEIGVGKIATVSGRYWAMDRDNLWDRVQRAYDAMALSKGEAANSGVEAMEISYAKNESDEFVQPTVIMSGGEPVGAIKQGDSVIFFNFRSDRARQITRAFIQRDFDGFERGGGYIDVNFVSMTQYDVTFENISVVFKPNPLVNTFGEYLAKLGKTQLRIAETQKYAHVTFFFNGGVEEPNPGEDRILIPSSKVATFDLKPEMMAYEVADAAIENISSGKYDVMILNFANCDMVGHTGIMEAAVKAVEAVDICVKKVVDAILATGGAAIVTADHGNAEQMVDPLTHEAFTEHTTNPVPLIVADPKNIGKELHGGGNLADIVPTLIDMMGLSQPAEMTGKSLLMHE